MYLEFYYFRKERCWNAATVITQVIMDKDDSAFQNPTKPIQGCDDEFTMKELMDKNPKMVFSRMPAEVSINYLFILTIVNRVAMHFGKSIPKNLEKMTVIEAEQSFIATLSSFLAILK